MTGESLKIKGVRLMFVQDLFTARAYKDEAGKPKKFRCKLGIPKNHPQLPDVMKEIHRLAVADWKEDKADQILASIKGNNQKMAFLDGDSLLFEGAKDHYIINASRRETDGMPLYVKPNPGTKEKPNLITAADGMLYSGAFVNANVSFWTWSKSGYSMNCNLLGLQFDHKGEAFSGIGTTSIEEFGNVEPNEPTVVGKSEFSAFI
jgi:hypothetical protein